MIEQQSLLSARSLQRTVDKFSNFIVVHARRSHRSNSHSGLVFAIITVGGTWFGFQFHVIQLFVWRVLHIDGLLPKIALPQFLHSILSLWRY